MNARTHESDEGRSASSDKDVPDLDDLVIHGNDAIRKKKRSGTIVLWVGASVGLCALAFYVFSSSDATRVRVTQVQRLSSSPTQGLLTATGYVVAQRQASVASKGTGRLTSVRVDVGDRVAKGDVIATLERADVKAALLQARARFDVATATLANARPELREATLHYRRVKTLGKKGLVTRAELDAAEARWHRARTSVQSLRSAVRLAQAEVQAVTVDLNNTVIRAPFDGTVIQKFAEVGEIVAPMAGASQSRGSVAAIADLRTLQVEAEISEPFLSSVSLDQPVHVALEAVPDHLYHGGVRQIVPTADRTKATVPVKIRIDDLDDKVLPDMSATVTFLRTSSSPSPEEPYPDALGVSPEAVVTRNGRTVLLLVERHVVSEVPVDTGPPRNGLIPIRGNVAQGQTVVVNPPDDLVTGSRVQERAQE